MHMQMYMYMYIHVDMNIINISTHVRFDKLDELSS